MYDTDGACTVFEGRAPSVGSGIQGATGCGEAAPLIISVIPFELKSGSVPSTRQWPPSSRTEPLTYFFIATRKVLHTTSNRCASPRSFRSAFPPPKVPAVCCTKRRATLPAPTHAHAYRNVTSTATYFLNRFRSSEVTSFLFLAR